ncbi:MAG: acyl-CoA reductase [Flavisolibacter sp.]
MNLQQRKTLLERLGLYLLGKESDWLSAKRKAYAENPWFIPEFIDLAARNIASRFLTPGSLHELSERYELPDENPNPKKIGIVMAGNIPLVGFHDLLCVIMSGHYALIKPSSKDTVLISHIADKLKEWEPGTPVAVSEMIRGCDAYIATGSNNSSRYFEYYFQKYPHIIRRNRTSVAVLSGKESREELERLADDVYLFFGLGCRNVTKILVPEEYDFVPLLETFKKYNYLADNNKYKNNYDYNLAMHILNNTYYMTNGSILLVEDPAPFSRISQLHYSFYKNEQEARASLENNQEIQCVVNGGTTAFGQSQVPGICDYADGVDTMSFLKDL